MAIYEYGQREMDHLAAADERLGQAIRRIGRIERRVIPELFPALVSCIVSQQVSAKAAETVWGRVGNLLGEVTPHRVLEVGIDAVKGCGLSMRKAGYVVAAAEAVADGTLDLKEMVDMPDDEVVKRLSALPGIGVWTAEMLLIFSLRRPDVVSWGDLAIRRGMMVLYGLDALTREGFEGYRQRYSPYGTVASLYLWALSAE